jgi:hypothetical protein
MGAVFFYRNAHHFCEQRLDHQTGVRAFWARACEFNYLVAFSG